MKSFLLIFVFLGSCASNLQEQKIDKLPQIPKIRLVFANKNTVGKNIYFFNENTFLKQLEVNVLKANIINVPQLAEQFKISFFEDKYLKMFLPADEFTPRISTSLIYISDFSKGKKNDFWEIEIENKKCKAKEIKLFIKSFIDKEGKSIGAGKLYVVGTKDVYFFNTANFNRKIKVCDEKTTLVIFSNDKKNYRVLNLLVKEKEVLWPTDLELYEAAQIHFKYVHF